MNKTIVILLVLVIVIVGGYFIFFNNNSNQTPVDNSQTNTPPVENTSVNIVNNSTTTVAAPAQPVASNITIGIKNFAFSPSSTTIKVGTKVTWINNDSVPHTITSDSGNLLNSSQLSPGQSFTFTFTSPGTTNYHCSIHPTMHGKIVVEA